MVRQKPVSRDSMQSYTNVTYYMVTKRESLIALGSHQGVGSLIYASAVPHRGEEGEEGGERDRKGKKKKKVVRETGRGRRRRRW